MVVDIWSVGCAGERVRFWVCSLGYFLSNPDLHIRRPARFLVQSRRISVVGKPVFNRVVGRRFFRLSHWCFAVGTRDHRLETVSAFLGCGRG